MFETGEVFQIRMAVATVASESTLYVNYQVQGNLPVGNNTFVLDAYTERYEPYCWIYKLLRDSNIREGHRTYMVVGLGLLFKLGLSVQNLCLSAKSKVASTLPSLLLYPTRKYGKEKNYFTNKTALLYKIYHYCFLCATECWFGNFSFHFNSEIFTCTTSDLFAELCWLSSISNEKRHKIFESFLSLTSFHLKP